MDIKCFTCQRKNHTFMSKAFWTQQKLLSDCQMIVCTILLLLLIILLLLLLLLPVSTVGFCHCLTMYDMPLISHNIKHKVRSKIQWSAARLFRLDPSPLFPVVIFSRWANGNNNSSVVISLLCMQAERCHIISAVCPLCMHSGNNSSWRLWSCAVMRQWLPSLRCWCWKAWKRCLQEKMIPFHGMQSD